MPKNAKPNYKKKEQEFVKAQKEAQDIQRDFLASLVAALPKWKYSKPPADIVIATYSPGKGFNEVSSNDLVTTNWPWMHVNEMAVWQQEGSGFLPNPWEQLYNGDKGEKQKVAKGRAKKKTTTKRTTRKRATKKKATKN